MTNLRHSGIWPWMAVAGCLAGGCAVACLLIAAAPPPSDTDEGVTGFLLGGSRHAFSADLFEQADIFFHRGAARHEKRVAMNDWIQRWRAEIRPEAHRHAEGMDSAEIIPWLRMATRTDPHNIDAWLVTAFWLETGLQRPDMAEQVLREAQRHNPGDYRVLLDRARLYVRSGRFTQAADLLDAALRRWPGHEDPQDRQSQLDKAEMCVYRAFLYEMKGRTPEAIASFKNALALFPERTYINERVHALETGGDVTVSARTLLENGVKRTTHDACDDEDHHDHDDGPEHETPHG